MASAAEHEQRRGAEADVPAVDAAPRKPQTSGPATAPKLIAVLKMANPRVRRASSSARIDAADLRRDIALEQPEPMISSEQCEQEALVEGHGEMAAAHPQRAEHDGVALSDPAVGDQPPSTGVK